MKTNDNPKGIWTPVWPVRRAALLRLLVITSVIFPLSWAANALLVGSWNLLGNRDAESVRHLIELQVIWIATVSIVFLASLLPPVRRLFGWLTARRVLFGLMCFVTLAALFYAEENWRGARAWNHYRQELEAGSAQLDLAAFVPQPVPDEQNFAATPFVKSWFERGTFAANDHRWEDNYSRVAGQVSTTKPGENNALQIKGDRQFVDLAGWATAFDAIRSGETNLDGRFDSGKLDRASRVQAAPAVLEGLKTNELIFAELRAAGQRPYSRYPIRYNLDDPWGILLPHLANVRAVCQRLQLKACAELAAGRSDDALADVQLLLSLADSVKEEPFVVSYLLRAACVHLAVQPVWEGLADHVWTDAQLQVLQARFQSYDFVASMKRPFDCERAAGALTAELIRKKGLALLVEFIGPGSPTSMDRKFANWCGAFIPRGWYYQEQLNHCRLYQMQLDGAYNPAKKRISPEKIKANTKALEREIASGSLGKTVGGFLNHRIIAALFLPALNKIPLKAAMAQAAADQTVLACVLERCRMANGSFPEALDALVPKFISQLPADVISGKPYIYRRTDDGQLILYTAGWDEKDDGGLPGKTLFDEQQGDWVWRYPMK